MVYSCSPDLGEVLTGAKLAEAGGVEKPSSSHGVELEHEEDEGQAAEDERKHHQHLHCLQPACRGRHRGGHSLPAPPPRPHLLISAHSGLSQASFMGVCVTMRTPS